MSANRSFLFCPGNHPKKVAKVFDSGADAVILDLEDAVAVQDKIATRATVVEALKRERSCSGYVRINSFDSEYAAGDVLAVVGPWLDGIVLPKLESVAQLEAVDWLMAHAEREAGMSEGSLDLMPIVETAQGIRAAQHLEGLPARVRRLSFGAGDYTLDLNLRWHADEAVLTDARAQLVRASRVAELEPPIDTVVIQINDADRFAASARRGLDMGFQGKLCIHPAQVAPCNEAFTPGDDEVNHARRVVAAFEEAEASGNTSIQLDGYFIDYAIVYKSQRILDLMEKIGPPA